VAFVSRQCSHPRTPGSGRCGRKPIDSFSLHAKVQRFLAWVARTAWVAEAREPGPLGATPIRVGLRRGSSYPFWRWKRASLGDLRWMCVSEGAKKESPRWLTNTSGFPPVLQLREHEDPMVMSSRPGARCERRRVGSTRLVVRSGLA